jgi:hypothetical protein
VLIFGGGSDRRAWLLGLMGIATWVLDAELGAGLQKNIFFEMFIKS